MFKLVVLFAIVAVVVAKPGYLGGSLAYSAVATPVAYAAHPVAVPAAVSHSYRTDVISKPVVATYAAPAVVAAPAYVSSPVVSAYAAPLAYGAHVPAIHAW